MPPHQNLRCLQIYLFSSLVLKELKCGLQFSKKVSIKVSISSEKDRNNDTLQHALKILALKHVGNEHKIQQSDVD